ncbi:MAG: hypothetical protein KBC58_07710 [Flavobacterium sp.]|nr:hypothetical protein [Flavobacterium sp.]
MIRDIITIEVNKPYKKIPGYLRTLKINPERIAISINKMDNTYRQIVWKDILSYDCRVKKIILLKWDNLFLYIGLSSDNQTIVYNEQFSKFILFNSILLADKLVKTDPPQCNAKILQKKINNILDKINRFGINSITLSEKNQLVNLSKFLE